ncbi:MAG: ATP-binding protein [Leptolyngbyaceae cyanobacterium]
MTKVIPNRWLEANQRYLTAALTEVRYHLEQHLQRQQAGATGEPVQKAVPPVFPALELTDADPPPALETLGQVFGLSDFERLLLLLCAGVELDGEIASLCARIHGDDRQSYATFSLAMGVLPEAHWSALYPGRPLRRWRLVEVGRSDGLSRSPLRIDERVLHFLTGGQDLDDRLQNLVTPVPVPEMLVPSHQRVVERLVPLWTEADPEQRLPILHLCGADSASLRAIAAQTCAVLGLDLYQIPAPVVPLPPPELEMFLRLWERESIFSASALLLDCRSLSASDPVREQAISRLIETLQSGLIVLGGERRTLEQRLLIPIEGQPATMQEQRSLWERELAPTGVELNGAIPALVSQFNLSLPVIRSVCAEVGKVQEAEARRQEAEWSELNTAPLSNPPQSTIHNPKLEGMVWELCRVQSRPRLEDLAQRIESAAGWEDLVLPESQKQLLQEIAGQVRQRLTVYDTWGFGGKGSRGLGISALFAGLSGTGKTMAAEVVANELRLDLYRIDLSAVVSKYIGETEKNLRRVFDAAEQSGAVLLFDEADALFGKRSDVKDSHDRYANIEVSYLLQRMEAYRGLAILTTNLKNALDTAFLRRIRFILQFPFPEATERAEIWRRIFPPQAPTAGLAVEKLAQLNASGGNIRNMAVYAAFLAAEAQEPVQMKHLLRAARVEFAKTEKAPTEMEVRGWV